jgi:hypothetical protein
MADLNEETTPEINEVEETVEEKRKPIDPSVEGIQLFYEKNKKMYRLFWFSDLFFL